MGTMGRNHFFLFQITLLLLGPYRGLVKRLESMGWNKFKVGWVKKKTCQISAVTIFEFPFEYNLPLHICLNLISNLFHFLNIQHIVAVTQSPMPVSPPPFTILRTRCRSGFAFKFVSETTLCSIQPYSWESRWNIKFCNSAEKIEEILRKQLVI